jgi:hypothetical protein
MMTRKATVKKVMNRHCGNEQGADLIIGTQMEAEDQNPGQSDGRRVQDSKTS